MASGVEKSRSERLDLSTAEHDALTLPVDLGITDEPFIDVATAGIRQNGGEGCEFTLTRVGYASLGATCVAACGGTCFVNRMKDLEASIDDRTHKHRQANAAVVQANRSQEPNPLSAYAQNLLPPVEFSELGTLRASQKTTVIGPHGTATVVASGYL